MAQLFIPSHQEQEKFELRQSWSIPVRNVNRTLLKKPKLVPSATSDTKFLGTEQAPPSSTIAIRRAKKMRGWCLYAAQVQLADLLKRGRDFRSSGLYDLESPEGIRGSEK